MTEQGPIFILGGHKSGTSLLRNLLDSHPDLSVLPVEDHFFPLIGYGTDYYFQRQKSMALTDEEIRGRFIEWITTCNRSKDKVGDSIAFENFDLSRVKNMADSMKFSQSDIKSSFYNYCKLIYTANKKNDPSTVNGRYVSKSVENAEFVNIIKSKFPNAKFIHIVRNPYASIVALRNYKTSNGKYPYLGGILEAYKNSYRFLELNKLAIDDYLVIRYEDLVGQCEEVMMRVAQYCKIPFNESLLKPTVFGVDWGGNSSFNNNSFSGVSKESLLKWRHSINDIEIFYVNYYFSSILQDYGYEKIPNKKFYRRNKGETFYVWLINRMIKHVNNNNGW